MGLLDDDTQSETNTEVTASEVDEEATLANGEASPPLSHFYSRRPSSAYDRRTPTNKSHDLLGISRIRGHGVTESEEIWEELEDDAVSQLSPSSRRRSVAFQSMPESGPRQEAPDESTALLSRSGTGRSYRDKGRRRSHDGRRRSASSQDAVGGWWKMKRWWSGMSSKSKQDHDDNVRGNGTGNGG